MDNWELVDCREAIDEDNPEFVVRISKPADLRSTLLKSKSESGVWLLRNGEGANLRIGVGPVFGFLWWQDTVSGFAGPAVNSAPMDIEDEFFTCEGVTEEVEPERLLQIDTVLDIVVEYVETGQLSLKVSWRIWDPDKKTWETRMARK